MDTMATKAGEISHDPLMERAARAGFQLVTSETNRERGSTPRRHSHTS
jgi:hypothetical protein